MTYKDPVLFVSMKNRNEHIYFCHAGRDICASNYCYGPAVREFYLIHVVTSGKGTYITHNTTYHIKAGEAFIIYPGEVTMYTADENEPWQYCFIGFNGEMIGELLERTAFSGGNMVISLDDDTLSETIINTAIALNAPMSNPDIYATSQLFCVFKILMDHMDSTPVNDLPTKNYVQQAINYIQFNYAGQITIAGIAKMLSINRSYFYRIFIEETGISPIEYLSNYRIDLAKNLLLKNNMPIAQIAMATGFKTFSSFYRLFLIKYGNSPRKYRSLYNEGKNNQPGAV